MNLEIQISPPIGKLISKHPLPVGLAEVELKTRPLVPKTDQSM